MVKNKALTTILDVLGLVLLLSLRNQPYLLCFGKEQNLRAFKKNIQATWYSAPLQTKRLILVIKKKTMKKIIILFVLLAICAVSSTTMAGGTIPSSSRSREAISKVKPQIEKDFAIKNLDFGSPIYIRIFKEEKELEIWISRNKRFTLFRKYPICTYGYGSLGPKTRQGDEQAPEGFYFVKPDKLNPVSNFHLSFNLGYPNKYDRVHQRTGGALMVHGNCVSIGCYAMTDEKIEEIYAIADAALRNGQSFFRVHIFPFRMTSENMQRHRTSKWYPFWQNLKEGYDFFEKHGNTPPSVEVENRRYVFNKSR